MRNSFVLLVFFCVRQASAQLVVSDPGVSTIAKLQLEVTQLHATFMKLQMVQDAVVLKNSYLQAKSYYDYVDQRSQHRGGLVGYYSAYFQQEMSNIAEDQLRQLENEGTTITGDNPVRDIVAQATTAIGNGTGKVITTGGGYVAQGMGGLDSGYKNVRGTVFTQHANQVAGAQLVLTNAQNSADATMAMIADLVKRGNSSGISDDERESIELQASLLQLQTLSQIRGMVMLNAQILNAQAKQNLTESAISINASTDLSTYRNNAATRRNGVTSGNGDAIIHEMQRVP